MDLATASRASKRLQAAGKKITTVTRVAHGTRGPQAKGARLFNSLFATHSDILIRVVCTHGLEAPDLWLRVRRTDMIYVLKVKLEIALATVVQKSLRAEDLDLEYKNMTLKDMRTFAMYHIVDGCELHASAAPHQPEKAFVPTDPEFDHLHELVQTAEGMPSSGMVKRIFAQRGVLCQVCWRRRWFRAEVMRVYPTSLLFKWHDWSDSDWCAARPSRRATTAAAAATA